MHTVHRNKVCEYLPVLAGLGLQVRLRIGLVAVDDEHFLMVCWRRGGLGLLVSLGCRCLLSPVHFLFVQPVDLMTLVYLPLLQHDGLLLNGLADFELHHHCAGLADFLSQPAITLTINQLPAQIFGLPLTQLSTRLNSTSLSLWRPQSHPAQFSYFLS